MYTIPSSFLRYRIWPGCSGQILYHTAQILYLAGQMLYHLGQILYLTGQILYHLGQILYLIGLVLYLLFLRYRIWPEYLGQILYLIGIESGHKILARFYTSKV